MTLITIVVPIYNVEEYLPQCLDSILAQEHDEIEVLCVDDRTPDNSVDIVRDYMARDSRIQLLRHETNQGLGPARNTGIQVAKGDVIGFIDSDDWIKPQMLRVMLEVMESQDADIVQCSADRISDGRLIGSYPNSAGIRDSFVIHSMFGDGPTLVGAAWNKIYRTRLFRDNKISYPPIIYEDVATTPRLVHSSKRVASVAEAYLNYRFRNDSIVNTTDIEKISGRIEGLFQATQILSNYFTHKNAHSLEFILNFRNFIHPQITRNIREAQKHGNLDGCFDVIRKFLNKKTNEVDYFFPDKEEFLKKLEEKYDQKEIKIRKSVMIERHYKQWSRGLDEKFLKEGHAPHDACTRLLQDDYVDISFKPKFGIEPDARYFAIGSCFARNIEAAFQKDGNQVLSMELNLPEEALQKIFHFQNETMTKFNVHSMEIEVTRAFDDTPLDYGLIELNPGKLWNPQLHRVGELSAEGQIETAKAVRATVRKLADADAVFITLGLTETWWDTETHTPLNDAPIDWRYAKRTGRFEFRNTGFVEAKASVERMIKVIRDNSNVSPKIILTVSPVPLLRTFSEADIITANSYSKSALRAVAEEIAQGDDFIDYFPSYEMVTYSPRHKAWRHDQRHVEQQMVWSITSRFRKAYVLPR